MKRNYPHVLASFFCTPWALLPSKLAEIESIVWRWANGGEMPTTGKATAATGDGFQISGSVAIVPIHGMIYPHASDYDSWFGVTSAEAIGAAVERAAADTRVDHIVLDVDSPGGSVYGMSNAAAKILAARKLKPVTAVANHIAASGAYWLASQATTLAVDPDGEIGSVGVIWPKFDTTKLEEMMGVKTDLVVSTKSPFKGAMWPQNPQTPENRAEMQRQVDLSMEKFIAAISKGRGVSAAKVEQNFGQGRMKLATEAVESKMADRIATLEQIINEINNTRTAKTKRQVAADLASAGFPTA